jgi:germination protein M
MLKKTSIRKILVSLSALFALFLIYLIPNGSYENKLNIDYELNYIEEDVDKEVIYLLDSYNMLGRSEIVFNEKTSDIELKARNLIQVLIKGGEGEDHIPNGFRSILSSETKILSLKYNEGIIKIDFSKDLLDIDKENEEKAVEAIVYTLTSIDGVDKVIIYVEGDILNKLPQTKKNLPAILDKSFGINKEYDITSTNNITMTTTYYINKYNDEYYYVPVSKFSNDDRNKITIIVDNLSSSPSYKANLMSFLNYNTKLLSATQDVDSLSLNFNSYIFNDSSEKKILEEVIHTISLSVANNYDVKELVFKVDDEEIYKTTFKTIE